MPGFAAMAAPMVLQQGLGMGAQALMGPEVQNAAPPMQMQQGPQGGPAMQILAGMQQQMQAEEQRRQQALMAILTQAMGGGGPAPQQPIQMES